MNFIGVDVHKNMLTIADIDTNLEINLLKNFNVHEFIEYIMKNDASIIAVDAPYGLNIGLMNDEVYRNKINQNLKGHYNKKVSEYELSVRGINPFSTPGNISEVTGWKEWMNTGFNVYKKLEILGYTAINSSNIKDQCSRRIIEIFPHACFTTLLGFIPDKKDTQEGLNQRIQLLGQLGFNNVDELIKECNKHEKTDKLDAVIAAYTAYLTYKGEVSFVGDIKEGQIVLPVKQLLRFYKRLKNNGDKVEKPPLNATVDKDKNAFEYEYLNVDSVLWFKYFTPLDDSPSIKEIIKSASGNKIKASIQNTEGNSIGIYFETLKNRNDGMKAAKEFKKILNNFWGSHGDRKKYKVTVLISAT